MREIEYKGTRTYITENDWHNLLNRFNAINAHQNNDGYFIIGIPCNLCEKYYSRDDGCIKCPLNVFEGQNTSGCIRLMHNLMPEKIFYICRRSIGWHVDEDEEVRHQLDKFFDYLKSLPRKKTRRKER